MNLVIDTVLTGVGATAVVDLWGLLRQRLLAVPAPNYGLVGRWIGHMPRGRFRHASIAAAEPIGHERAIGWTTHYLIGIAFAALLPAVWSGGWFRAPSLGPALLVGIVTVAAPFLLMQPGMGAGIAASRMPRPGTARLHSLVTHAIFGLGLFVAAWAIQALHPH
jgi:hypothetical protein